MLDFKSGAPSLRGCVFVLECFSSEGCPFLNYDTLFVGKPRRAS